MSIGSGDFVDTSAILIVLLLRGVPDRHRKPKLRLNAFVLELQSFFSPEAISPQCHNLPHSASWLRSW
jgi:hypothetical protein